MPKTSNIRNVAILGHQGCGKTSLVESLYSFVYKTEKGSIERKNTISDYLNEEKTRLSSTSASIIPIEYKDHKINLIDVPGNDDFLFEAQSAAAVVKGAILVISAPNKVQIETVKHFNLLKQHGIPTVIFVNKMDRENVNFDAILEDIQSKLAKEAIPFSYPLGKQDKFDGYVDIVKMKAYVFDGKGLTEGDIHEDKKAHCEELHNMIKEKVAVTNDALLEKYFAGEELTEEEVLNGLKDGVVKGELFPVIVGSSTNDIGLGAVISTIINYLPGPNELKPYVGKDDSGKEVTRACDDSQPFSGYVFKTSIDPYLGTISVIKVCSGVLKTGDDIYCPNTKSTYKVGSLFALCGKKQTPITSVSAGDIAAIGKLDDLTTGYTVCDKGNHILYEPAKLPSAVYFKAIDLKNKKDEDKFNGSLNKLKKEDPCLEVRRNEETRQLLVGGLSDSHLQFVFEKLKNNFGIEVVQSAPKVCYRETIKKTAEGDGRYVKQSGGAGQYGVVKMRFEPAEENSFDEEIFGGAVPKQFFPAVEKGFYEGLKKGGLAGFPVIGVKGVLVDGKYHPVDSKENAFTMAGILALKDAYAKCAPTILEPILKVYINIGNEYLGDILSDLSSRRAKVLSTNEKGHETTEVEALIPEAEAIDYVNQLKALTQGSGFFNREFYEYEEVPQYLIDKVIKENSLLTNDDK